MQNLAAVNKGECFNCDTYGPLFSETSFSRGYCKTCLQTCVFCQGYCDYHGCMGDEGQTEFDLHDCYVNGQITCDQMPKIPCKYRYCMACTKKCPDCGMNIILKDDLNCRECRAK